MHQPDRIRTKLDNSIKFRLKESPVEAVRILLEKAVLPDFE